MAGLLQGKVSLVTGAGSDIGRAISLVMAREGAIVVVSDIDAGSAGETLGAVKDTGGDGMAIRADVSNADDLRRLIAEVVETWGRLDCACNDAGGEHHEAGRLHEYPEDFWNRAIDFDLKSVLLRLKHEIPQMLRQGGGAIVNIASTAGLAGSRRISAYAARDHALVGLTRTAALEYAAAGIRINAVCPGIIGTRAERRPGAPAEIAEAVAWLCSDAASLVTGAAMGLDGGLTAQ